MCHGVVNHFNCVEALNLFTSYFPKWIQLLPIYGNIGNFPVFFKILSPYPCFEFV